MPSLNLQLYLQARANGASMETAAEQSGIGIGEARLHERDIERGELELPRARAPARTRETSTEESEMARDTETTVQIGDGPKVPLEDFEAAAKQAGGPSVSADKLRLFIERIERLHEERQGIADDIRDVFQEAKSDGFDTTTMKRCIKIRKMETHTLQEAEALLDTYLTALGMTPIEHAIAMAA